jgi:lipoprotein-releasing system permease protein
MRGQRFLPLLSIVSIAGVTLGVLALVTVLSVMRGFSRELEKKLMGFNAHVTITRHEGGMNVNDDLIRAALSDKYVKEIAPFVEGEAIAQSKTLGEVSAAGVRVHGIDPSSMGSLRTVEFYFPEGSAGFNELRDAQPLPGIILGSEILAQLTVHPDFEDKVELVAPLAEIGPAGELMPVMRRYTVSGAFRSGIFDYDSKVAFVSISEARRLLGAQAVSGFHITLIDSSDAPRAASMLKSALGEGWNVDSWEKQNRKLFAALKLERYAMSAILLLIVLIASFSIVGVIMMIISAKRKDIATLRAIGMNDKFSKKIFLYYGFLIGAVGSITGGILGSILCGMLMRYPVKLPSSYYLDLLPVDWSFKWTAFFVVCGIIISVCASLYPVSQATAETPAATLRYE